MTTATPTQSTPAALSEQKFNKLKAKLRELFELDKSDLDFGIYRIMAAKNAEVSEFLDRRVRGVVQQTLAEHESGEADAIRAELDEKIASLKNDGLSEDQIEAYPAVKALRERLREAGGKTGEELQADVYNHLLAFFSRYYDEGDFISQRRYKGDTYAIPYSGEEVTLHWANKDQYYIKSGEWHKDYRFKLPSGKRVRFALIDATQDPNNVKESDDSKRRYVLLDDEPVAEEDGSLVLRFAFRSPTEDEKSRAADGAVAIFGGKYEKSTKGDERTQFCADAERRALADAPGAWRKALSEPAPTNDKPNRTVLGKHLDHFTARNTFDYFIHKDLGGFLRRELDFYIKNEVVRLDDLDEAPAGALARVQGRVRAIRRVASSVIDLLASIEDFQKKLWLKKKFVLNTSWLVTVDRIPEKLRDTVANNKAQWEEWERLGFKPGTEDSGGLFAGAKWGSRDYLDKCDKLVVDTRLFDEGFTTEVLASEEMLSGMETLDEATSGTAIWSDNLHAVSLLQSSARGRVHGAYIDPPYNTENDTFVYKDRYKHSSWRAMIADRLAASRVLLRSDSSHFTSIDGNERDAMSELGGLCFGQQCTSNTFVWVNNLKGRQIASSGAAGTHEYVLSWSMPDAPRFSIALSRFKDIMPSTYKGFDYEVKQDDIGPYVTKNELYNTNSAFNEKTRPNLVFVIHVNPETREVQFSSIDEDVSFEGFVTVWPKINNDGEHKYHAWRWGKDKIERETHDLEFDFEGERPRIYTKVRQFSDTILKDIISDIGTYSGARDLDALFRNSSFPDYPKPVALVEIFASQIPSDGVLVDYFAGSGTTAQAVVNLNRWDSGFRRFLLVEAGPYFGTVLKPRIVKVIYSPDWKNGEAQTHGQGLSALVKCFAVESYEDALNNLPAPEGEFLPGQSDEKKDVLLRYALDLQLGPHLLDLAAFRDPWGYEINAQLAGEDEVKRRRVDLVETFNYLLGLKVSAYGPRERYSAEFETAEHDEGLGRVKVKGRLKKNADGPYTFHRVEGVLNDGVDTRVLVVWRTLTDNPERDAAVLQAWMDRHRESTTERSEHREYQLIYINGPVTLPQPTSEIRTVLPIEETFKAKMFEGTDEGGLG